MTSQPCPPSALRPLPTTQQTRVEIQPLPTPFNSKDFVEMTESMAGGPKEHQRRIENQQPQWQPLALGISSPKTPHPAPRYPQPRIRENKNHPTEGDLGNSLTSPTHRPPTVELGLRGVAHIQFSRAHRVIYLFETNNNGRVTNDIEQGSISRFMKKRNGWSFEIFLRFTGLVWGQMERSGNGLFRFLIAICE